MKTRKLNNQKKIQKFITIQKLKSNELLKIKGGADGDAIDQDFD